MKPSTHPCLKISVLGSVSVSTELPVRKTPSMATATTATGVQWSTLPSDILATISKTLNSDIDLLRLRSVCSRWRSSLPPPPTPNPSFPLKIPPLLPLADWSIPDVPNGYFLLNQHSLYRLSPPQSGNSSDGWLFKVSPTNAPNTFSLLLPLSSDKVKSPPGMLPIRFNLLDYRIVEICNSYSIEFVDPDRPSEKSIIFMVRKVIVLWNYVADCAFAVLVLRHGGRVICWKFGDDEWITLDTRDCHLQDLLLFDGKCYGICNNGVLVYFDSELNLTEVGSSSVTMGWDATQQNYLVECESELYVVAKIPDPDVEFYCDYESEFSVVDMDSINQLLKLKIFKKKCGGDWLYLRGLGDKVLFLGDDVSFGVSSKDFDGFKGNCIFLTDECFYDEGVGSVYGDDTGVCDLDLRSVKSLTVAQDHAKLFWPPPSWLMPCACSSRFRS